MLMLMGTAPASAQGAQAADILSRLESKGVATSYAQWGGRGYRRGGYYGRRHYGHRGYYGRRGGVGTGALIGGLAAGALLGGVIASQAAPGPAPVYAAPQPNAVAYCSQRFRSYDPGSGTYLGYDGMRHACP
jgi:hypothetical protein